MREGAIIPTQPPMDYVGERLLTEVTVEVFPDDQRNTFDYYDDDGSTYAYEHGAWFDQMLTVQRQGNTVTFETGAANGSFKPALRFYLLKIHGDAASEVRVDGKVLTRRDSIESLRGSHAGAWAGGHDRFGAVTWVRLAAGRASRVQLSLQP